jgi:DNA-binding response OmpR family regulator
MSILIVDSSPGSMPRVKAVFEEYGLTQIHWLKTAAEARSFVESRADATGLEQLTLIIIDNKLDDGDGLELCRQIRNLPAVINAWVMVLVSSAENKTAIETARHSGANDFGVKPYESPEFLKHLMLYANRKTVLLVEDDPVIRQMVAALLYKKHLELIISDDGMKASNLINSIAPPRLVMLDIGLPGMNGVKLAERIRSKNLWRKTPVVMITGSKESSDVKGALAAGANDYIVKPFQIADFQKRIDKFLTD